MKLWKFAIIILLFASLSSGARSQNLPQPPAGNKNADNANARPSSPGSGVRSPTSRRPRRRQTLAAPSTSEATISSKEGKELFRSVDEILQFASQDTGLPIKHKVKRRLAKRDEVQKYLEKSMKDDKDAKRLERSSAVLKKFGLLPRNFDLATFLVAMLREQVAGYYDVKTKTVNLLNWLDVEQQKPVLAHELTHALQDQSFGIEKWMKGSAKDLITRKMSPVKAISRMTRRRRRGRPWSKVRRW